MKLKLIFSTVSQALTITWNWTVKVAEATYTILAVIFTIGFGLWYLTLIGPILSPVVTILFVLCGTGMTWMSRKGTCLSTIGLIAYGLSWIVATHYGGLLGAGVCAIGIGLWFWAVIGSFFRDPMFQPVPVKSS